MKRLSCIFLLVLLASYTGEIYAQDSLEPIVATDLLKVRQLGEVTVSPDGRHVVYSVRSIIEKEDEEGEYEYRTQLWIADARDTPRPLTSSPLGAAEPAWHPDGDRIAFSRAIDGIAQVFVMSMYGGEPYQVTRSEYGASEPQWSPDGTRLLFASTLPEQTMRSLYGAQPWSDERPRPAPAEQLEGEGNPDGDLAAVRTWLERNRERNAPSVISRLDFQGERKLEPTPSFRHYYLIEEDSLGSWTEPRSITPLWGSFASADWHPDGARVLLGGKHFSTLHPDRVRTGDIYITYVNEPFPRRLFSLENQDVSRPLVSPDGQTVAFTTQSVLDPGYKMQHAGVFPLDDPSDSRILTTDLDRSVSQVQWSRDNWHLYFVAPSNGGFPLYRVQVFDNRELVAEADTLLEESDLDAPESLPEPSTVERLSSLETGIRSFDVTASSIYYVQTRFDNPYELYTSTGSFDRERRITDHNASWLASRRVVAPEHRTVLNDGFEIDYWIMRPADGSSAPWPMVLQIHGGPSAMWGPGEASMWHEFQFLAARGYVVVYSNPRGSGGYGARFMRANFQDWTAGPASDVLAVADAVADLPFVDQNRQAVTGGSYAGYLTVWIIAHDDRFRAAVAQRGVYDLTTFLGEGNAWRLVPSHFGGYPWEDDPSVAPPPEDPWRPAPNLLTDADAAAADTMDAGSEVSLDAPEDSLIGADSYLLLDAETEPASDRSAAPSFREILIRESPLSYVPSIDTPLLIMHGDRDLRTGVSQSEMLYRSLKLLDKPVEYVRYPQSDHELSRSGDPLLRLDRVLGIYEFMERWVR